MRCWRWLFGNMCLLRHPCVCRVTHVPAFLPCPSPVPAVSPPRLSCHPSAWLATRLRLSCPFSAPALPRPCACRVAYAPVLSPMCLPFHPCLCLVTPVPALSPIHLFWHPCSCLVASGSFVALSYSSLVPFACFLSLTLVPAVSSPYACADSPLRLSWQTCVFLVTHVPAVSPRACLVTLQPISLAQGRNC